MSRNLQVLLLKFLILNMVLMMPFSLVFSAEEDTLLIRQVFSYFNDIPEQYLEQDFEFSILSSNDSGTFANNIGNSFVELNFVLEVQQRAKNNCDNSKRKYLQWISTSKDKKNDKAQEYLKVAIERSCEDISKKLLARTENLRNSIEQAQRAYEAIYDPPLSLPEDIAMNPFDVSLEQEAGVRSDETGAPLGSTQQHGEIPQASRGPEDIASYESAGDGGAAVIPGGAAAIPAAIPGIAGTSEGTTGTVLREQGIDFLQGPLAIPPDDLLAMKAYQRSIIVDGMNVNDYPPDFVLKFINQYFRFDFSAILPLVFKEIMLGFATYNATNKRDQSIFEVELPPLPGRAEQGHVSHPIKVTLISPGILNGFVIDHLPEIYMLNFHYAFVLANLCKRGVLKDYLMYLKGAAEGNHPVSQVSSLGPLINDSLIQYLESNPYNSENEGLGLCDFMAVVPALAIYAGPVPTQRMKGIEDKLRNDPSEVPISSPKFKKAFEKVRTSFPFADKETYQRQSDPRFFDVPDSCLIENAQSFENCTPPETLMWDGTQSEFTGLMWAWQIVEGLYNLNKQLAIDEITFEDRSIATIPETPQQPAEISSPSRPSQPESVPTPSEPVYEGGGGPVGIPGM